MRHPTVDPDGFDQRQIGVLLVATTTHRCLHIHIANYKVLPEHYSACVAPTLRDSKPDSKHQTPAHSAATLKNRPQAIKVRSDGTPAATALERPSLGLSI